MATVKQSGGSCDPEAREAHMVCILEQSQRSGKHEPARCPPDDIYMMHLSGTGDILISWLARRLMIEHQCSIFYPTRFMDRCGFFGRVENIIY